LEKKNDEDYTCYYCGIFASGIDHVIPRAILRSFGISYSRGCAGDYDPETLRTIVGERTLTVPCCRECNTLLGSSFQKTLGERKAYLKMRLKRRYKKLIKMPNWKEEEILELGPTLRQNVRASLEAKKLILARIRW